MGIATREMESGLEEGSEAQHESLLLDSISQLMTKQDEKDGKNIPAPHPYSYFFFPSGQRRVNVRKPTPIERLPIIYVFRE